jgi:stage III sporulation protein AH
MKIIIFGKNNKYVICFTIVVIFISIIVAIQSIDSIVQVRVNRSNATQVTTKTVPEQVLPNSSPDFFVEYRLERDKFRSERTDFLRESIKDAKNDDNRHQIQEIVLKMIAERQKEAEIESLIKASGFADALVVIRDNSVSAIVKTTSLSREEVIQVADVIRRVSGLKAEDISISAKP